MVRRVWRGVACHGRIASCVPHHARSLDRSIDQLIGPSSAADGVDRVDRRFCFVPRHPTLRHVSVVERFDPTHRHGVTDEGAADAMRRDAR
jgi:hypothetical protein